MLVMTVIAIIIATSLDAWNTLETLTWVTLFFTTSFQSW